MAIDIPFTRKDELNIVRGKDKKEDVAGTWATSPVDATYKFGRTYNSSNAVNNKVRLDTFNFVGGVYDIHLVYGTGSSGAIVDVKAGTVMLIDDLDMYSVGTVHGANHDVAQLPIAVGLKDVTVEVVGKNGGSSGHYASVESLTIVRV